MQEIYDVTGMSCAACSARVEKSVAALPGVRQVSVNLLKNSMTVDYDEQALTGGQIVAAVVKAGYGASPQNGKAAAAPSAAPGGSAQAEYAAIMRGLLW